MSTKHRHSHRRFPSVVMVTLMVVIVLGCSLRLLAQEKNGDETSVNPHTNNGPSTGRVNFNIIQLMNGEYLEMFGTGTSRGILRGHPSISGIELGSLSADPLMFSTDSVERMRILANGFVGIGMTSPAVTLDVSGNTINLGSNAGGTTRTNSIIKLSRLSIPPFTTPRLNFAYVAAATTSSDNIAALGGAAGGFSAATVIVFHTAGDTNTDTGTERMRIDAAGNIGIGTSAPAYKVDVVSASNLISKFRSIASQHSQLLIDSEPAFNANLTLQRGGTSKWYLGNRASNDRFSFIEATGNVELLALLQNGNLGVGTISPTEKLEVIGNIKVSGNINAKYQDVAEWVDSSQQLSPGTVVVLDATKSNQVIASTRSYDSRIAGVISQQPGLTLGEAGEGRVLVATTGRVRVKVDATDGPIEIGDLLVTSTREGFAMKSKPVEIEGAQLHRPGTLIGKALEPLPRGTGEILVLLSLQ